MSFLLCSSSGATSETESETESVSISTARAAAATAAGRGRARAHAAAHPSVLAQATTAGRPPHLLPPLQDTQQLASSRALVQGRMRPSAGVTMRQQTWMQRLSAGGCVWRSGGRSVRLQRCVVRACCGSARLFVCVYVLACVSARFGYMGVDRRECEVTCLAICVHMLVGYHADRQRWFKL